MKDSASAVKWMKKGYEKKLKLGKTTRERKYNHML